MKHSRTVKATNERSEELRPGSVGRMAYVFTRGPLPRGWGEWKHWRPHLARLGLAALALAAGLFASTVWAQQGGFSVTTTTPSDGAAHVPVEANIIVKFSAPVDPASLTPQTVQVNDQPLAELENGGLAFPEADSAVVLFRMKANAVYQITLAGSVTRTQFGGGVSGDHQGKFQRVERQDVAVTIVVEDHVHAGGALQIGIKINAKQAAAGKFTRQAAVLGVAV